MEWIYIWANKKFCGSDKLDEYLKAYGLYFHKQEIVEGLNQTEKMILVNQVLGYDTKSSR